MRTRLANVWDKVHTSFWFVPVVMAVATGILSLLTVEADRLLPALGRTGWLWSGEPQGAREMLTTIAGSMITVAGVSFSITVVALTLAANQFGPRLLRTFMQDTGNQVVLGTFISTFLFCLLTLRAVQTTGNGVVFVPNLSITIGLFLAIASLGVLIYLIHHVSVSLQAEHLAASIAQELRESITHLFPERLGASPGEEEKPRTLPPEPDGESRAVTARHGGYVQTIENENLIAAAEENDLVFSLHCAPGEFVNEGATLVSAWPAAHCDDRLVERTARMFVLGRHRTPTQDAKYSAQQLVSVAVRALSPGINDPFTAVTCIDWLGSALVQLAQRKIPSPQRMGRDGKLRVVAPSTDFPEMADVAFNQIRRFGGAHVAVLLRMLEAIEAVAPFASREGDRAALLRHADLIEQQARQAAKQPRDLETVTTQYQRTRAQLTHGEARSEGMSPSSMPSDRA